MGVYPGFVPIAGSKSFAVADYPQDLRGADVVGADGTCTIEIDTVPSDGQLWLIERIVVATTSANNTSFGLYRNTVALPSRVDWTDAGNADVAEETQEIRFRGGDVLIAQWTGGTPGANCYVTIQYRVVVVV